MDWAAISVGLAAVMALCATAASWGDMRRQVTTLRTEIEDHRKQTRRELEEQDARLDKVELAITKAAEVGHAVALLRGEVTAANTLITTQQLNAEKMAAERFEGLRGEVRAFMQGQAASAERAEARANRRGTSA